MAIVDKDAISYLEGYQEGKQEGKRDVVEWVEENSFGLQAMDNYCDLGIDIQKWQAFKESKGLA